ASRARAGIAAFAARSRLAAAGTTDQIEVASWAEKAAMARRYQGAATDAADDAALQAEADLRGTTVEALATVILTKAAAYKLAAGKIQGWQRAAETHVDTETANGDVDALVSGLATIKADATAELEALLQQLSA
ncbi:MAG: hypothetical protein NXI03_11545, partial [Alphaproteobacteria bacterium]|nr:hypothetical protein [Alphaproteobacteria bacterium]